MKKREHEFRRQADEMSNLVLSHELKVKLLTKELENLKNAGMKTAELLKMAETTNLKLKEEIICKDWELKDLAAVKHARYEMLDHFVREKDAVLASVKDAHAEQIQKLENQIRELQRGHKALEMELRKAEWRHTDCLREKEA
uniref:Uncharacterized protein n=1 Tax=Sphenodon punctatus TaxID=8508 RepID=A0A8D0GH56_SPHPU